MKESRRLQLLLVALISSVFLLICFVDYSKYIFGTAVRFVDTDPYYHVRRIWLAVLDYPHVPAFDYYIGYPEGSFVHWPVGFDFFVATFARIMLGGSPDIFSVRKRK